jgi:hypothetical protein
MTQSLLYRIAGLPGSWHGRWTSGQTRTAATAAPPISIARVGVSERARIPRLSLRRVSRRREEPSVNDLAIDRGARPNARPEFAARVAALDWPRIGEGLDALGYATTGPILATDECAGLRATYADDGLFRSRVVMSRHGFGRGEYRYYAYPLPAPVAALRAAFYRFLAPVANRWQGLAGHDGRYPPEQTQFLAGCRAAGQTRPTPLLLRYGPGDYNCLHQDLYGGEVFPVQVAILLSEPAVDFAGGEFLLTEQRPRGQSRAEVVPLGRGEAVIFAVNQRPVRGARRLHHVRMRHGVSRLRRGERYVLGLILHDAA